MVPSYDPHTQKLITSINENGETVYAVESYSVEEMNDGSEWYVTFFKGAITMRLKLIDTQVIHQILSSDTTGLQMVQDYKNQLSEITDFSPGFTIPTPPVIDNVKPDAFLWETKKPFKFKNTMDITTL